MHLQNGSLEVGAVEDLSGNQSEMCLFVVLYRHFRRWGNGRAMGKGLCEHIFRTAHSRLLLVKASWNQSVKYASWCRVPSVPSESVLMMIKGFGGEDRQATSQPMGCLVAQVGDLVNGLVLLVTLPSAAAIAEGVSATLAVQFHGVWSAEALVAAPLALELGEAASVFGAVRVGVLVLVLEIAAVLSVRGGSLALLYLLKGRVLARVTAETLLAHGERVARYRLCWILDCWLAEDG